jgi:hypothetical protein
MSLSELALAMRNGRTRMDLHSVDYPNRWIGGQTISYNLTLTKLNMR